MGSAVISVRLPRELKEEMDRLRDYVDWEEEIKRFLERRVAEIKRKLAIEEARKVISGLPEVPRGTTASYVREDRESR